MSKTFEFTFGDFRVFVKERPRKESHLIFVDDEVTSHRVFDGEIYGMSFEEDIEKFSKSLVASLEKGEVRKLQRAFDELKKSYDILLKQAKQAWMEKESIADSYKDNWPDDGDWHCPTCNARYAVINPVLEYTCSKCGAKCTFEHIVDMDIKLIAEELEKERD